MSKNFQPVIDELRAVIDISRAGRLTPADEQKGAALFKELVATGGKALSGALELIGDLPWFIPVNGTLEAWPELTPVKQRNFLSALKPLESETARRMRFSIARGLYRVDPASALKLLITSVQVTRTENGFEPRDRQTFSNVLIGKNKPWLAQIDLKTIKPADAKLLALAAIESSAGANPPAAMAVIQWAKPVQKLVDLPDPIQQELAKNIRKWSTRWQKELAGEELPPLLDEAVKTKLARSAQENPVEKKQEHPESAQIKIDSPPAIAPHSMQPQHREQKPHRQERKQVPGREIPQRHNEGLRAKVERPDKRAQQDQRRGSDISELLRQIDSHFQGLRNELQTVRNQLKQSSPQSRQNESAPAGNKEIAKLREENSQLAETVRQLRETLSELATEDFEEAVSRKADTDSPVTDPLEQYKSLITLRLREQIVNFQELNPDKHVDGLPLLLDNILRTLFENGIDLTNIDTPPTSAKRRY
jgi:hypothetical protein